MLLSMMEKSHGKSTGNQVENQTELGVFIIQGLGGCLEGQED